MPERSWFECWRDPKEFFCAAWQQIKPITKSAPPQNVREAYVAGLFARIWNYNNSCEVRLIPDDRFPDAQLHDSEHMINFEIAIADRKGRPTWREQKKWAEMFNRGEFVPADSPEKRRADAQEAIARIVKQKVEHYLHHRIAMVPNNANLLIYLMTSHAITEPGPVIPIEEMETLTAPYKNNFEAIWLLCGREDVRVWPRREVLRPPPDQDPFNSRARSSD